MQKRFSLILSVFLLFLPMVVCTAQTPREGFITTKDGVRLFYKIVGDGRETLVAVHGGPGNSMNSILADLEPLAKNRTVIYYDQRGNGRSDLIKEREKLAVEKHVEDLEAVRRHFKLDKMTLLGNSWGGLLISYYAAAHPDKIERMILHNPAEPTQALMFEAIDEIQARIYSRYNDEQRKRYSFVSKPDSWMKAKDPRAICREFFQLLFPTYVAKPEIFARFKGDVCSGSEEAVRQQQYVNQQIWRTLGNWNLLPSLGAVKAPVLVIHGEVDPIPVESSEAWAQGFPNARLLVVKDSGHLTHVEQPEIFFKAVETFLQGEFPADAKKIQPPEKK
ncbi:MAG TPA: alpha/beta hydrolase [Pyrinomonadaceae bacterium]|jgi:proline iminopeptidase